MIAIIPDPVQTHMALRFDRAIDAIELAAESMGYGVDRYWLPWDVEAKADWSDYDSFIKANSRRDQKEAQPGLLMFRWVGNPEAGKRKADQPTVLYVFLVGESATAGVEGGPFAKAVKYADRLNGVKSDSRKRRPCHPPPSEADLTYVLGPTSSSGFASLATHFPGIGRYVLSLLQPGLESFK